MSDEQNKTAEADSAADAGGGIGGWFRRSKARLDEHFKEYGVAALLVYLTIWIAVWIGFAIAISAGYTAGLGEDAAPASGWGVVVAAWVPTKLTQPFRIGATLIVTPMVAELWLKVRGETKPDAKA